MTTTTRPHRVAAGSTKAQILQLESICELQVLVRRLYDYFGHLRADVESVAQGSMPLDVLEGQPDVLLMGSGARRFSFGNWAVQVRLTAHNGGTSITLRATGDDAASRALNGRRSTISLASSVKKMEVLARLLRAMEEEAEMTRLDRT
jgi:hypothetical protein